GGEVDVLDGDLGGWEQEVGSAAELQRARAGEVAGAGAAAVEGQRADVDVDGAAGIEGSVDGGHARAGGLGERAVVEEGGGRAAGVKERPGVADGEGGVVDQGCAVGEGDVAFAPP